MYSYNECVLAVYFKANVIIALFDKYYFVLFFKLMKQNKISLVKDRFQFRENLQHKVDIICIIPTKKCWLVFTIHIFNCEKTIEYLQKVFIQKISKYLNLDSVRHLIIQITSKFVFEANILIVKPSVVKILFNLYLQITFQRFIKIEFLYGSKEF